jgi:fluoride exporter
MRLLLIALGGAVGASLRYGVGVGVSRLAGVGFPFGTLAANLLGSFLLGLLMEAAPERPIAGVPAKLVLGTGLLGGFTTYSSFNLETLRLAEQGQVGRAALYVGVTGVACLLAGAAGMGLARSLRPPS